MALSSTVERLSIPPTEDWLRRRIFTLLSFYFEVDRSEAEEAAIASDWMRAIMVDPCPPAWAIDAACVGWISGRNARKRPLPGDIRDLAFEQMPWLISGKLRLRIHENPEKWAFTEMGKRLALLAPDPEPTQEQRARVTELIAEIVRSLQSKKTL